MKILHTADLHLRTDEEKTVDALRDVLQKAAANDVDLLTIGGDVFDSPGDADALRPELRDLLTGNPFDIVAIPGNHDEDVYRKNLRFGEDLDVLVETPYSATRIDGVEIVGVPFTSSMTEALFSALERRGAADRTQVLLLHCTLDIGFGSAAVGTEEGRYFPVTKSTLGTFDFDYVLAGHVHSTDREVPLDNGGTFIYPGSPVSHSTTETGRRKAVLIDTEQRNTATIALDTFYHDELSVTIRPGAEADALERIEEWVSRRRDDECDMEISVDGFVDADEDEFYEELAAAAEPVVPDDDTRTVSHVLDHPLYRRFLEKMDERERIEDEEMVRTRVLEVLSRLLAENRVQAS